MPPKLTQDFQKWFCFVLSIWKAGHHQLGPGRVSHWAGSQVPCEGVWSWKSTDSLLTLEFQDTQWGLPTPSPPRASTGGLLKTLCLSTQFLAEIGDSYVLAEIQVFLSPGYILKLFCASSPSNLLLFPFLSSSFPLSLDHMKPLYHSIYTPCLQLSVSIRPWLFNISIIGTGLHT